MASVLFKNAGGGDLYQYMHAYGPISEMLNDDASGVAPALTLNATAGQWQNMPLQSAGTFTQIGCAVASTCFQLNYPASVSFLPSAPTVTFNYEIDGVDHFGDAFTLTGSKIGTGATTGGNNARTMRVFSAIKAIRIQRTDAGGGTPTVTCGYVAGTGAGTNAHAIFPLPFKLPDASAILGFQMVNDGGGVTAAGGVQNAATIAAFTKRVPVAAYGGGLDSANANGIIRPVQSPGVQGNPGAVTPNTLARFGIGVVQLVSYTNVAANVTPVSYRWIFNAAALQTL
jgi:hypothetical protein